ncbi:MAG: hypothetical protein ACYDCN_05340 [Bacteroidia bacterium]
MHNLFKYNTEVPDKFHQAFIKTFLLEKPIEEIKKEHKKKDVFRSLLYKRKRILNNKFEFTKENVLKFEALSNKLNAIQAQILSKHRIIVDKAREGLIENGGTLIDLEVDISIQFYIECEEAIDPIYEMNDIDCVLSARLLDDADTLEHINANYADYEIDWGEAKRQFAHFHQSRLFHHLYHEGYLALQDILLITTVWYDIIIEHQTREIL